VELLALGLHIVIYCYHADIFGRKNSVLKVLAMRLVLLSAALLLGCARPETVSVSGSTTVLPIISKAADAYQEKTGQAIIVTAGGSGAGFNQLAEGLTDIGMMSRDITAEELSQHSGYKFKPVSIGIDAVAPVISSEIYDAGVTALSLDDIALIYKGQIDNWSAFGGPDKAILVIDKEASSGTRHTFMKVIMGSSQAKAPGADLVLGANNEEQTAIAQSDAAIGMLSLAWINEDVRGIAVKDGTRHIQPNLETVASGHYPIARDLTIVVRNDIKPEAQSFIDYLLGPEGQDFVKTSGYIKINP